MNNIFVARLAGEILMVLISVGFSILLSIIIRGKTLSRLFIVRNVLWGLVIHWVYPMLLRIHAPPTKISYLFIVWYLGFGLIFGSILYFLLPALSALETFCESALQRIFQYKKSSRPTFVEIVSRSIAKKRAILLACLVIPWAGAFPIVGISLPILAIIVLVAIDLMVVLYRQWRGLYGNNDLEFSEAVHYVMTEQKSGRGPGQFEHVFPVPKHKVREEVGWLPTPARPA